MADTALTGRHEPVPTGNFTEISRRQVLAGGAVTGAASLAPLVASAGEPSSPHPLERKMASARAETDARFWQAYREHQRIIAAWNADPDYSDESFDRWGALETAAHQRMLMIGVFSVSAIAAKLCSVDSTSFRLPDPIGNARQAILWDLERAAKLELFGKRDA